MPKHEKEVRRACDSACLMMKTQYSNALKGVLAPEQIAIAEIRKKPAKGEQ